MEIRVQVMGNQLGFDLKDAEQMSDCFFKKTNRRSVVQTADVLRQESLFAF